MNKLEALQEIFDIDGIYNRLEQYNKKAIKPVDKDKLLALLAKDDYNLLQLHISASTISKLLSFILPDRDKTSGKPDVYLLNKYGLKFCAHCGVVKELEEFNKNSGKKDGVNPYCRECHNKTNATTQTSRTSKYRAAKLNRTPKWADQKLIKEIYNSCPIGYHVDHIIPLQGELVSGLHVENNLQYLPATENLKKHNKFAPIA